MGEDVDPWLGRRVAERYLIEDRLGSGGMGVVYRARQEHMNRRVAIKMLRPDRVGDEGAGERLLDEARAVSQLTSPHTVTVIEVGPLDEGGWFIAMELLEGFTLRDHLDGATLATDDALRVVGEMALSLAEAHARGIVHRDLKPSNVLLAETPGHAATAKVLDFGIASLVEREAEAARAGTPRYMAPEAIGGESPTPRVDVYALGIIAYELLAGTHPFADREGEALLSAQLTEPPPPLAERVDDGVPGAVVKLVERCLAKHPRLRPADGAAVREAWRRAMGLREEAALDRPSSPSERISGDTMATLSSTMSVAEVAPPSFRWGRWGLAAAALVTFAGAWTLRDPTPTSAPPPPASASADSPTPAPAPAESAVPEPPPREVDVLFHTIPDGASITIDGEAVGETPLSVSLPEGATVRARLSLPGFLDYDVEVTATADGRVRHVFAAATQPPIPSPVERKVDFFLD